MGDTQSYPAVIVTGGAQGIGAAIVRRFAREGYPVLVADIQGEVAEGLARELRDAGQTVASVAMDVRSKKENMNVGRVAEELLGSAPGILILCAGAQTFQFADQVTEEEWDFVQEVNSRGTFFGLQGASHYLADQGAVVAVSSIQARLAGPLYPHYSASKAAILSLVRSFAVAMAPRGIRVNAVAPGVIMTDLWHRADKEISALEGREPGSAKEERIARVPLKRAGTPEDVANSVFFLASPDASYITGETIHVCGGDVML